MTYLFYIAHVLYQALKLEIMHILCIMNDKNVVL